MQQIIYSTYKRLQRAFRRLRLYSSFQFLVALRAVALVLGRAKELAVFRFAFRLLLRGEVNMDLHLLALPQRLDVVPLVAPRRSSWLLLEEKRDLRIHLLRHDLCYTCSFSTNLSLYIITISNIFR